MRIKIIAVILLMTVMLSLFGIQVFGAAKNQAPGGIVTDYESLVAALGGEYCVVTKDDRIVIVKDIVLKAPIVITNGIYRIVGEGATITADFEKCDYIVLEGDGTFLMLGDMYTNEENSDLVFDGKGVSREGSFIRVGEGSKLSIYKSVDMVDAVTTVSGGAVYNYGELEMYGGRIIGCRAVASGGAVFNLGDAFLAMGTIDGCTANHGGAVYNEGELRMAGTSVKNGVAANGGGVFNSGKLEYLSSEITGCKAGKGGGLYNSGSTGVKGGSISLNTAEDGNGGGIYNASQLTVSSDAVRENSALNGGNIYNTAELTLVPQSSLFGGKALENGGNLYNGADGKVKLEGGSVSGGKALYGGGIFNEGVLEHSGGGIFKNAAEAGEGVLNCGEYLLKGSAYIEDNDDIFVLKDEHGICSVKVGEGWSNSLGVIQLSIGVFEDGKYLSEIKIGDEPISAEGSADIKGKFALFGSPKGFILSDEGQVAKAPIVKLDIVLTVIGAVIAFALTVTALVFAIRYFDKKKART